MTTMPHAAATSISSATAAQVPIKALVMQPAPVISHADAVELRWVYDHSTKGIIVEYSYNQTLNADGHTQGFQVLRYEEDNLDTRTEFEYSGTDMLDENGEYAAEYENACKILRIGNYDADDMFYKNNLSAHLNDPEQFASLVIQCDNEGARAIMDEVKAGSVTEKRITDIVIQ